MDNGFETSSLPPRQDFWNRLFALTPSPMDRILLGAAPVFIVLFVIGLFFVLGWWGLLAAVAYLITMVVFGTVVAYSRQTVRTKAALAVLAPAACISLLAAIPKALGLI